MIRVLVVFSLILSVFLLCAPVDARAELKTKDPNDQGYDMSDAGMVRPVSWDPYSTNCQPCTSIVEAYNATMAALMRTRYQIKLVEDKLEDMENLNQYQRNNRDMRAENKRAKGQGLDTLGEQLASAELAHRMALDDVAQKLPALRQQEQRLAANGADLRGQVTSCENKMCGDGNKKPDGVIGDPVVFSISVPFAWKGPYPEVCQKCAKLAARLNELPGLATQTIAQLEAAQAQKALVESEMQIERMKHSHAVAVELYGGEQKAEKEKKRRDEATEKNIAELEKRRDALDREIERHQGNLDEIKRNFDETLKLYNECVPTCPKQTGALTDPVKKGDCHYAALPERFIIGPNSEYGSGAAMKDKVKGMAGSALGGLMGGGVNLGGGIGLGGGGRRADDAIGTEATGGGRDAKGPPTEKDPTSGKWDKFDFGYSRRLSHRLAFEDNELIASVKIDEAPGDGTFHAAFLQDGSGNTITPKYHLYSLYYDWKLTVWWTYDHWTDGVHDYHDEGEEVTTGRNNVGDWKVYDKPESGIWSQYGFGNASKGINGLGMEYDISKLNLSCPLRMTTYITEPKADPVIATPVSTYLERVRNESGPSGEWKFINDMMVRGAKDAGGGGMQLIDPPLAPPPPPP